MMIFFNIFAARLAKLVEMVRGNRSVSEILQRMVKTESLMAYAVEEYTLTIHCKERRYLVKYDHWFIPDKVVKTYEVFATVAGQAPPALIEAAHADRTFPKLLMNFSGVLGQKEAAIEAFIDLMQEHLKVRTPPKDYPDSR